MHSTLSAGTSRSCGCIQRRGEEHKRERSKQYHARYYQEQKAAMTDEQLAAVRAKQNEATKRAWAKDLQRSRERARLNRLKHADKRREDCRKWRERNRERVAEYNKQYQADNPEKTLQLGRKWKAENREYRNQKLRERHASDPRYKIEISLRNRLQVILRTTGARKPRGAAKKLLGCTLDELFAHLESQFKPGMSWDNYGRGEGRWHIDHIKPCASFDLIDPEQQKLCFHYTNLQPLWEVENLRKGPHGKGRKPRPSFS